MCSRTKQLNVAKQRVVAMQSVVLKDCILIWVGDHRRVDSLGFAFASRSAILLDDAATMRATFPVDSITSTISKLFPQKQVFFSTDLSTEDNELWSDVVKGIAEDVASNKDFYGIAS
ncbi:unnamed protein product [Anisakis simplex]|uniref:PH domain-containing protein n=1 Tax=Anisakis simplex TaxID=6269 RepID=A0A0M3JW76_ANISI|nr:unnamed protein product [Anisakis simplex]